MYKQSSEISVLLQTSLTHLLKVLLKKYLVSYAYFLRIKITSLEKHRMG